MVSIPRAQEEHDDVPKVFQHGHLNGSWSFTKVGQYSR